MKKLALIALCGMLPLSSLAFATVQSEKIGSLPPRVIKELARTLKPILDREAIHRAAPRPDAADLMVHPIQVEKLPSTGALVKFRLFVPISNIGRASSAGIVVKLMGIDAATGRERLSNSCRLPALAMNEMSGLGTVISIAPATVARRFSKLWVVLEPSDRRTTTTYSDANNANNTVELSGEELVRKLGL